MSTVAVNILVAIVALVAAVIYSDRTEFALQKIHEIVQRKPGCNPIGSVGHVNLHYFAGRGRGEVIRLLMATAGIPWNETKFTKETWPEAKTKGMSSGLYTFGQGMQSEYLLINYDNFIMKLRWQHENVIATQ